MKISGGSTLDAPVDTVWEAIQDPAVLARCIPGCEALRTLGVPPDLDMKPPVTAGARSLAVADATGPATPPTRRQ